MSIATDIHPTAKAPPKMLPVIVKAKEINKAKSAAKQPHQEVQAEPEFPRSLLTGLSEFPYKAMSRSDANKLHDVAVRIRGRESKSLIEDGRDFIRIKDLLDHGQFTDWLNREDLPYNKKSAQRAMSVARMCDGRSKHLEALPVSVLYDLAAKSIPDAVKDAVSAEADKLGRAPHAQWVWKQISAAEADRKAKKPAKAETAKANAVAAEVEPVQQSDDLQEAEVRGQKTRDAVAMLVSALGDDLPKFVELMKAVNFMEFRDALDEAVAQGESV